MIIGQMSERDFDGIRITQTRTMYSKTASGKSWKKSPDYVETKEVSANNYINCTQYRWRGDRTEKGYTYVGYIPVKVSSTSPDGKQRCTWSYSFDLVR